MNYTSITRLVSPAETTTQVTHEVRGREADGSLQAGRVSCGVGGAIGGAMVGNIGGTYDLEKTMPAEGVRIALAPNCEGYLEIEDDYVHETPHADAPITACQDCPVNAMDVEDEAQNP